jgi:GntR family transcriptional regulator, transcriptional repressor for pyruvate dehydrogenase complex
MATRTRSGDGARSRARLQAKRKPLKAAEALARDIVDHIVERNLPEGTRLSPEREMLVETGRARSTLREALRLLETRGVIEIRQGNVGGPVVRRPRAADLGEALTLILLFEGASMLDVIEAREEMEALTVGRAAGALTPEQLDALQESIDIQLANLDDGEVFLTQSRRFHTIINEAAATPVLSVLNEALQRTTHVTIGTVEYSVRHRRSVAIAHRAILDALRASDADAARAAMRAHVRQSGTYWRRMSGALAHKPLRWLALGREAADRG